MELHKVLFFCFSLITQISFSDITQQEIKKSSYFLLFSLITLFSCLIPTGIFTFILESVFFTSILGGAYQPLHTAEQGARCYWVIQKWRDSRAVLLSGNTSTVAHPKIKCSSQAGQLSHSSAEGAAELLLPACRDTQRSLGLGGTAFTISS